MQSNPVGKLKELTDSLKLPQPVYTAELRNGSWTNELFVVLGNGTVVSASAHAGDKKQAKAAAAVRLLVQLEQDHGMRSDKAAPVNCTHKSRLQDLLTRSSCGLQALYSHPISARTPGHPVWQSTVTIISAAGAALLTASGTHSTKVGSHEAAASQLLSNKQLYTIVLAGASPAVAAGGGAAAPVRPHAGQLPSAAVKHVPTAPAQSLDHSVKAGSGHKGHLQELLQIAASKQLPGWTGQLPQYCTTSSGLPHCMQHTSQVSVTGPAGTVLTASSAPMTTKKQAEQAAAAAVLQLPELQQLRAAVQRLQQQGRSTDTFLHQLHELVQQTAWCMEEIHTEQVFGQRSDLPLFEACVIINGHRIGKGWGKSKADASQAAAQMALASMGLVAVPSGIAAAAAAAAAQNCPQPVWYRLPPAWQHQTQHSYTTAAAPALAATRPQSPAPTAQVERPGFASTIQKLSLQKFNELVVTALAGGAVAPAAAGSTVVSAYLLQQGDEVPEVIALGSGTLFCSLPNHCISSVEQRGRLILDSHAEVIARRSLLRWLYQQSRLAIQAVTSPGRSTSQSVFEVLPANPRAGAAAVGHATTSSSDISNAGFKLRLKPNYKIHMYVSKVPCGDARDFKRPAHSSANSISKHFNSARPNLQLAALPSASRRSYRCEQQQQQAREWLPAAAALKCHWPLACMLLNPAATGGGQGKLRGKVLAGEVCVPLPAPGVDAAARSTTNSIPNSTSSSAVSSRSTSCCNLQTCNSTDSGTPSMNCISISSSGSLVASDISTATRRSQNPVRKVCCSDKLARLNALGLQGALLGQWVEPVYISSLTIGGSASAYCEGAVCRAVCCRLAPDIAPAAPHPQGPVHPAAEPQTCSIPGLRMTAAVARGVHLPAPYRVNHPEVFYAGEVAGVPVPGGHGTSRCSAEESLNWSAAEQQVLEITSGSRGVKLTTLELTDHTEPAHCRAEAASNIQAVAELCSGHQPAEASRLSKAELFECYKRLQLHAAILSVQQTQTGNQQQANRGAGELKTYAAAKAVNTSYTAAKQQLYQHFERAMNQSWMRRSVLLPDLEQW